MANVILTVGALSSTATITAAEMARVVTALKSIYAVSTDEDCLRRHLDYIMQDLKNRVYAYERNIAAPSAISPTSAA